MSLGGLVGGRRVTNTITYVDKKARSTVLVLLFVCLFVAHGKVMCCVAGLAGVGGGGRGNHTHFCRF